MNCPILFSTHVCITDLEKQVFKKHLPPHESHMTVSLGSGGMHYSNWVNTIYTCLTTRISPLCLLCTSAHLFHSLGNLPPSLLAQAEASASPQRPELQGPAKPHNNVACAPISLKF